ncbi:MAG: hypothetical protein WC663_04775 [Patescibacteria group bacterium]|jgi:hypothetical protein
MHEQIGEISQKDIMESGVEKTPGLEIAKTEESEEAVKLLDEIAGDIENDLNIKAERMIMLREALGKLRFNFGAEGETMTAEELKKVPDMKENVEIYEAMKRDFHLGRATRIDEVTYLTPGMAEEIIFVYDPDETMSLMSLKVMTDKLAEVLGNAEEVNIRLPKLNILTGKQLRSLLAKTNTVSLRGLDTVQVDGDLAITIDQCAGRIVMDDKQIDRLKELFPKFEFRRIMGH